MLVSYCVSPDTGLVWRGPPEPRAVRLVLARHVPLQRRVPRLLDEVYADAVALMQPHRRQTERIDDLVVGNGCLGGNGLIAALGQDEEDCARNPVPEHTQREASAETGTP